MMMSRPARANASAPRERATQRRFPLRPVTLAASLLLAAPATFGLPQGAKPTFGQTTVKQTAPNQLNIQQTTQRAGIDWTVRAMVAGAAMGFGPGSGHVVS